MGAAPPRFRDVQLAERTPYLRELVVGDSPPTDAVSGRRIVAGRREWHGRACGRTSRELGRRSDMGTGRRGRQTLPRLARGIDAELAALRGRRQKWIDFAGSVEGTLPRDPPASRDWDAAKFNRATPCCRHPVQLARSLRFFREAASAAIEKREQSSLKGLSMTPLRAGR